MSAAPAPPPRRPQQNRYSTKMLVAARQLYGDGNAWTPTEIRRFLEQDFDEPIPTVGTIRRWVIPAEAEAQRQQNAECAANRQERRARITRPGPLGDRALDRRMLEMRRRGLSYSAIAQVVDMYHGVSLTEEQVRGRLRKHGVQPSANRSAAMRRLWAEQKTQGSDRAAA